MVHAGVSEERSQDLITLLARELEENLPIDPQVAVGAARAIVAAAVAAAEHRADLVPPTISA